MHLLSLLSDIWCSCDLSEATWLTSESPKLPASHSSSLMCWACAFTWSSLIWHLNIAKDTLWLQQFDPILMGFLWAMRFHLANDMVTSLQDVTIPLSEGQFLLSAMVYSASCIGIDSFMSLTSIHSVELSPSVASSSCCLTVCPVQHCLVGWCNKVVSNNGVTCTFVWPSMIYFITVKLHPLESIWGSILIDEIGHYCLARPSSCLVSHKWESSIVLLLVFLAT
jgi:hypothetical protein